jgi:hypothetical protein
MFSVSIPTLSTSSTDFSSLLFRLVMLCSLVLIRRSKILKDTNVTLKTSTDVRFNFRAVIVHGVASSALTQFWRIAKLERRDI